MPIQIVFCLLLLWQTGAAQYRFDSWTTDNGLPQVSVNSIVQTRDGFLWFTTYGGLVRYDGLRFQVFNTGNTSGLRTSRLLNLFEDRQGNLWIITEGQGVTRYADGVFRTYTTNDGLPDNQVSKIYADAHGDPVFAVGSALLRWTGTGFAPYMPAAGELTKGILQRTASGAIWYVEGDRLRKSDGGHVTIDMPGRDVLRLFEDTKGRAWIASAGSDDLLVLQDGKVSSVRVGDGQKQFRFVCAFEDRQGRVWFGTPDGLMLFQGGRLKRYTVADGLTRGGIGTIYQDREGTIWAGGSGGLNRVSDRAITTYSGADGIASENIYPIYEDRQGRVWIGSWAGLTVYEDGAFQNVGARYGVAADLVSSLLEDRNGNLWIGCWSGKIVRVEEGRGRVIAAPGPRLRAIYQDHAGDIWVGTANGLARFKDGDFTRSAGNELAGHEVFSIYEDRQQELWLGTDAGLFSYRGGAFTPFEAKRDAPSGTVRSLHEDQDGALWIGTYDGGLYRYKQGRFTRYTTKDGLFDNGAFEIVEDDVHNFWISCNLGIYRVRKSELDDLAEGRTTKITSVLYNKRDGMLNSECNGGVQPAGVRTHDGRIWFPTQQGVAVIDPAAVPSNPQPPPVVIESVVVQDKALTAQASLTAQPGDTYFEFHYSGLSYINPELVKFKYRLAGLDRDWVDAGTRRVAYYSHLPPGKYRFIVQAANRDGIWNEQGAALELTVLPPFWRTWWFVMLAACTVVALSAWLYRRRIGQLQRENAARETFARQLIESQENERRRIAAELHDSLGQSLVLIKNWAMLGLRAQAGHPAPQPHNLDEISTTASAAINEVREIAYNLGPYQLDRLGLSRTVAEMVERVGSCSSTTFSAEIDPLEGVFSKPAEVNVFRIAQEAVNNVVKHSGARSAKLFLKLHGKHVTLTVRDDGRGFAQTDSNGAGNGEQPRGFGLLGLQERVRLLGGTWSLKSEPAHGTTINVTLPCSQERDGN